MIDPVADRPVDSEIEDEIANTARDVARKVHLDQRRSSGRAVLKEVVQAQWRLLAGASIVCVALTLMNLFGMGPFDRQAEPLSPVAQEAANRQVLQVEAAWVEAYRLESGNLPETLPSTGPGGVSLPWRYERLGQDDFRITVEADLQITSFDSRVDDQDFFKQKGGAE